jgi:deazaflavin-dependent oxidoreductase (nitroreductase family)
MYLRSNWFARRVINPVAMRTRMATTLAVRARKTGELQEIPVNVLVHDGVSYLVSVRGESQWVRNLRAAGTCELRQGGRQHEVKAEELPAGERAPVIAAYRKKWGYQVAPYFRKLPDAADHPVFRLHEH